jgi:hypothetical protein
MAVRREPGTLNGGQPIGGRYGEVLATEVPVEPDAVEKMYDEIPLSRFSVYTHIQSKRVIRLGREVVQRLERGISGTQGGSPVFTTDLSVFELAYGDFWLWVVGAYEVVRTMCQAEPCFSPRLVPRLTDLKEMLAKLRMPFAKQELHREKSIPVDNEPSVYDISHSPPDLKFKVKGEILSAREMIEGFERVFSGITRADVLADHRTTYPPKKGK